MKSLYLLTLLGVVAAIALFAAARAPAASANPGMPTMRFRVLSGAIDCTPMQEPTSCSVLAGTSFQLGTAVDAFPAGGYTLYAVDIDWSGTGLVYKPTMDPAMENLAPGAAIFIRNIGVQRLQSAALAPLGGPPFTYKGPVHRITINCTSNMSSNLISLLPFDEVSNPAGSVFGDSNGNPVPVPATSITINCVQKQPEPVDTDGDGCSDQRESGMNPATGGQRNFLNFWDFYDTWTRPGPSAPWMKDKVITVFDVLEIARRFGTNDMGGAAPINRNSDPLTPPVDGTSYHPAYDRSPPPMGFPLRLGPPDGVISVVGDINGYVSQATHSCL